MKLPRWLAPGAVAFLAVWLLLLAAGRSAFFHDPGTFWHTTTGELVLKDGFLRADPYTFTFAGEWWVPYQWLGEVGMAARAPSRGLRRPTPGGGYPPRRGVRVAGRTAPAHRPAPDPRVRPRRAVTRRGRVALPRPPAPVHARVHGRGDGTARDDGRRAPAAEPAVLARTAVRAVDERPRRRAGRNRHAPDRVRGVGDLLEARAPGAGEVLARRGAARARRGRVCAWRPSPARMAWTCSRRGTSSWARRNSARSSRNTARST